MTDSVKRLIELLLPGALLGGVPSLAVGGVAFYGGLPDSYVVISVLAIGLPLTLFGAGYSYLLAQGRIRLGGITPAAGYWLVGYIVSRTIYEVVINTYLGNPYLFTEGALAFFGFQILIAPGFAVGFMWLHEHLAPRWWIRIRDRNPIAAAYVDAYTQQAVYAVQSKKKPKAAS